MRVAIVGGCGHVGLPLGLAFAKAGYAVTLLDVNADAVATVKRGVMPFGDEGCDELLPEVLASGRLAVTTDRGSVASAEAVVFTVGTPVNAYLDPDPSIVPRAIEELRPYLNSGQLIVLRSTVYPGVSASVARLTEKLGLNVDVAFCPERVAEGQALKELYSLPQIVSGCTLDAERRAGELFSALTTHIVPLSVAEAELAKLFTNTWRYLKFAAANQLFMLANDQGLDFGRIRAAVVEDYPRARDMPRAGFAAGPCLFKDAMQLGAFSNHNFTLGNASMLINEGLPFYIVEQLGRRYDIAHMTIGILGMAFKPESGDSRDSLSYKLKKLLLAKAGSVICSDPYVTTDPELVPLDALLEKADVLVVGTPHEAYRDLRTELPLVDITGLVSPTTIV